TVHDETRNAGRLTSVPMHTFPRPTGDIAPARSTHPYAGITQVRSQTVGSGSATLSARLPPSPRCSLGTFTYLDSISPASRRQAVPLRHACKPGNSGAPGAAV